LLDIYWNILTMHGPINVKSPNNTSKWQMGFNSAFKGLIHINISQIFVRVSFKCTVISLFGAFCTDVANWNILFYTSVEVSYMP
jgi:hypothetical protein